MVQSRWRRSFIQTLMIKLWPVYNSPTVKADLKSQTNNHNCVDSSNHTIQPCKEGVNMIIQLLLTTISWPLKESSCRLVLLHCPHSNVSMLIFWGRCPDKVSFPNVTYWSGNKTGVRAPPLHVTLSCRLHWSSKLACSQLLLCKGPTLLEITVRAYLFVLTLNTDYFLFIEPR